MKTKQAAGSFVGRNYLSWIVYGLAALVIMLMQNAPNFFPPIFFARPAPLVLFVVCVAMFEGYRTGAAVAIISGFLWDLYSDRVFGFTALQLLFISVIVALLVQWLLRTNFWSSMLLCVSGVLVQMITEWFFRYVLFLSGESLVILWRVYLPNALYTIILSPLVYWLVLFLARFLRKKQMN